MIRITYFELRSAIPALQKLFQQNFTNMKFLLKLRKLLYVCEKEIQAFEDIRVRLVERFGEEVVEETTKEPIRRVKPENQKDFEKELDQVFSMEVQLDVDPITLEELEAASDGVKLEFSAMDLKLLEKFFSNV